MADDTPDVCEHLQSAKQAILAAGGKITFVGQAWSRNCRNWMYFSDVYIDADALKKRLNLPGCVVVHSHLGTHDGQEHGLICEQHQDAVMGPHRDHAGDAKWVR
jgi:hypothetical protein